MIDSSSSTSPWHDTRYLNGSMKDNYPSLFALAINKNNSVLDMGEI